MVVVAGQLSLFEEEGDFIDLNEAEEMLRSLKRDDPDEFARIANLRDGIRSARALLSDQGRFVFCQAGKFQQLFLTDAAGQVLSREVPTAIGRIKCSRTEPAAVVPKDHNDAVMKVLQAFASEVRHRRAQQKHSLSLTTAQSYVLRELRAFYSTLEETDDDLRGQVSLLEEAFKRPLSAAVRRDLNALRRNGVTGRILLKDLSETYHEHGMHERIFVDRQELEAECDELPRIICSEAFT